MMKKTIYLFVFAIITISCDSLDSLLELNINNDLTENIAVSVSQTQGVAASFDLSETTDLNSGDLAEYRGKISAIKINKPLSAKDIIDVLPSIIQNNYKIN